MLHNVMSIFTFVGGGLLQQDDNYSLQVITNTLQTIIPALLQVTISPWGVPSFPSSLKNLEFWATFRHTQNLEETTPNSENKQCD